MRKKTIIKLINITQIFFGSKQELGIKKPFHISQTSIYT